MQRQFATRFAPIFAPIFAPGSILVGVLAGAVLLAALCLNIALSQPWLGLDLAARDGDVVILRADPDGPMAGSGGAVLVSLGAADGAQMALTPDDLTEEPDTLGDGARMRRFVDRQAQIHAALTGPDSVVILRQDGTEQRRVVTPHPRRPLVDLPWQFWAQIGVGIVGLVLGAWVVTLRPGDLAAWMLCLAGAALALAAMTAAIYSTRELALHPQVLGIASRLNGIGTLSFGIGMVTLFLVYPRRLVRGRWLALPAVVICAMLAYALIPDWPRNVPQLPLFVAIIMVVLLAAILAQVWANRRDPVARAMMGWLGLSVALGAGGFVLTVILPTLLGLPAVIAQGTAFLFFLLIYAGVALGVARYRLFDLADWTIGVLYYAIGAALLLAVDALLIFGLALDRLPALSLSLAVICLTYLPLRHLVLGWLRPTRAQSPEDMYRRITRIANTRSAEDQFAQIQRLWADLFHPLSMHPVRTDTGDGARDDAGDAALALTPAPALVDNGRALVLPRIAGFPALRLDYAQKGGRLFSTRDQKQAASLGHLLEDTLIRHRSHVEAIAAERSRINRDMHDNLGILLLSALHSPDSDRKNSLIRQTLSDLRDIVSHAMQDPRRLTDLLADLRAELSEVSEAAAVAMDWQVIGVPEDQRILPQTVLTLRALLRESVSNALRHAGARRLSITLTGGDGVLHVRVADDGRGFDPQSAALGSGLVNLRLRLSKARQPLAVTTAPTGTVLTASLDLGPPQTQVAA